MLNWFTKNKTPTFTVEQLPSGRFGIVQTGAEGGIIATYSRKRDAERGATRRGLTLA